jgi:uncharacterized protein
MMGSEGYMGNTRENIGQGGDMSMTIQRNRKNNLRWWLFGSSLIAIISILITAFLYRFWVLTALPIGMLFGFFLQKGDLCGASAFSEVMLMRDWRKIRGLWVCIVVSMILFATANLLGWIPLNPKPLLSLNYIIGGIVFGVGTVLAGGCISGCTYKAAMGNLNSIAALFTIPIGIAMVEYGPLHLINVRLSRIKTVSKSGGAITLPSLTGLPFWTWAVFFSILTFTIAVVSYRRQQKISSSPTHTPSTGWVQKWLTRNWKPWQAGIAIGVLALFAYISSTATGRNYPLGVTHGVLHIQQLLTDTELTHVFSKPENIQPAPKTQAMPPPHQSKKIIWWLVFVVIGLFWGSLVSSSLAGQIRLLPKPPGQILTAFFGGLLLGIGAALASGCVIGNIMSGWALLSVGMFLFGFIVVGANWLTTYFYLMGGTLSDFPGTIMAIFTKPNLPNDRNKT